jgi:hypothetical protein
MCDGVEPPCEFSQQGDGCYKIVHSRRQKLLLLLFKDDETFELLAVERWLPQHHR